MQQSLGEGLALRANADDFLIFRDHVGGLEYVRSSRRIRDEGLFVELAAYKYNVLLDFREVPDADDRRYARLEAYLEGRGVPSIDEALREIVLQPLHGRFEALLAPALLRALAAPPTAATAAPPTPATAAPPMAAPAAPSPPATAQRCLEELCADIRSFTETPGDDAPLIAEITHELDAWSGMLARDAASGTGSDTSAGAAFRALRAGLEAEPARRAPALAWILLHRLGRLREPELWDQQTRSWLDEWRVGPILEATLRELGQDERAAAWSTTIVKLLVSHQRWHEQGGEGRTVRLLETLLADGETQRMLRLNRHQGVLWFNRESFEQLLWWLLLVAAVQILADVRLEPDAASRALAGAFEVYRRSLEAAARSGYQVEQLLAKARKEETAT